MSGTQNEKVRHMISKIYFDCGVDEIAGFNRNGANKNSNVNDDDMWIVKNKPIHQKALENIASCGFVGGGTKK